MVSTNKIVGQFCLRLAEKSGEKWTEWSDWSNCIKTYKGCYRAKHRICLAKDTSSCTGADDWGVQSKAQKCPSPRHCQGKI